MLYFAELELCLNGTKFEIQILRVVTGIYSGFYPSKQRLRNTWNWILNQRGFKLLSRCLNPSRQIVWRLWLIYDKLWDFVVEISNKFACLTLNLLCTLVSSRKIQNEPKKLKLCAFTWNFGVFLTLIQRHLMVHTQNTYKYLSCL
jgi:hypothetical protein